MNCSLQKPTYVPLLFPSYGNNDNLWPLESPEVILIFTSLLRCSYISPADICITRTFLSILFRFLCVAYLIGYLLELSIAFTVLVTDQVCLFSLHIAGKYTFIYVIFYNIIKNKLYSTSRLHFPCFTTAKCSHLLVFVFCFLASQ